MIRVLLALGLADPVVSLFANSGADREDRQPVHVVLLIDGSYSMLAESDGRSRKIRNRGGKEIRNPISTRYL